MWNRLAFVLFVTFASSSSPVNLKYQTLMPYELSVDSASNDGFNGTLEFDTKHFDPNYATIMELSLEVQRLSGAQFRVKITDKNSKRWEPPYTLDAMEIGKHMDLLAYNFTTSPFSLRIFRIKDNVTVFKLDPSTQFQYDQTDIILTNTLDSDVNFYGLGERVTDFRLNPGIYTIWNRDQGSPFDDGKAPGKNMYGSHPFYLATNNKGDAFGGFLHNSNAMDVTIKDRSITFRTIGGVIDMFIFSGPCPASVVSQYHEIIGKPVLIPYWSLGWHQCRWGYTSLNEWKQVVGNYNKYQIPLDVMWTDIDYMYLYWDFSLDYSRYPKQDTYNFVQQLKDKGKRFVPIMDAGVAQNSTCPAYQEGLRKGIFMQSAYADVPAQGSVWPGHATFVDWFHPNATDYWVDQFKQFYEILPIDGVWLDMNEASNFCNGECWHYPALNSTNMAYVPGQTDLNVKNMDLLAKHYTENKEDQEMYIEYNIHSTYGFLESKATNKFLVEELNTRPFIISRSTFPGHGRYASHWLGDNFSEWAFLRYSITGIFNFQMFGIPMVGADICGFNGNTTAELCARWTQLGALYPFSRNHNTIGAISQEPWAFGQDIMEVENQAIRVKYGLLQYFYSQSFKVAVKGGTFFHPTFFNYPQDEALYREHDTDNFMLGRELLVHPVLDEGVETVDAYFPADIWYNYYTGDAIVSDTGILKTLSAKMTEPINIHVRGGSVVPQFINYNDPGMLTSVDLRKQNLNLIVALDSKQSAEGFVVFDQGSDLNALGNNEYTWVNYKFTNDAFIITPLVKNYQKPADDIPYIEQLTIYGIEQQPNGATLYLDDKKVDLETDIQCKGTTCVVGLGNQVQPDLALKVVLEF